MRLPSSGIRAVRDANAIHANVEGTISGKAMVLKEKASVSGDRSKADTQVHPYVATGSGYSRAGSSTTGSAPAC